MEEKTPQTISPNDIIELRQRMGMTQRQFAQKLGTDVGTVSRWERGFRSPSGLYAKALFALSKKHATKVAVPA